MKQSEQQDRITVNSYIERDVTDIIKGVALVFMFIHHFFTIPSFYIDSIRYDSLSGAAQALSEPFKICVPIFAFLTGYFYVFAKKKSIGYSLKKSTDVWLTYFVFFLLLLIPAAALGCWDASVKSFFLEAFGVHTSVMIFCWYVIFYIISILLLPLYHLAAKRHILIAVLLGLALPMAIRYPVQEFVRIPGEDITGIVNDFLKWFPCIAAGYIAGRYGLFEKVFVPLFSRGIRSKILRALICVILMLIAFMGRYFLPDVSFNISVFTIGFGMDFIYAPMFIFGLVGIVYLIPFRKIFLPLAIIGKYSLGMWFVHCIFFNMCKEYTQPILYFPKNPVLVVLWGLLICLAVSAAVTEALRPLLKLKNKLLFKNC